MKAEEKSLEELRAAVETDQEESGEQEATGTQEAGKSEELDASQEEETSTETSEEDPSEDNSDKDEWVVPGRFKTHEDVLKAYGELESFTGRQGSEIQKLRQVVTEPPRRGESADDRQSKLKRFADAVQTDPVAAIQELIRQETGQVRSEAQAKEFERAYFEKKKSTEFNELEPIMTELATKYGDLIQANGMQNDPRLLEILEYAAKGVQATALAKQAKSEGVKKGQDLHRRKQKARLEGSSGTKKTRKLDISKLSASEMKAKMESGDIDISE